jgi:AbrB family looped-hinge helix DNA binding protein
VGKLENKKIGALNMAEYFKTRLRPKGQVTLPSEIRELLNLNEGDDLAFSLNEQGQVVISRLEVIPPDQAWFWSERWQRIEREAQADIEAGRVQRYENVESAIAALEKCANAGD